MKRGFTLIELLVVVLIIGILSSIALPQYQKAVNKARFTAMGPVVDGIAKAEEIYFMEYGEYTDDWDDLEISFPLKTCGSAGYKCDSNGNAYTIDFAPQHVIPNHEHDQLYVYGKMKDGNAKAQYIRYLDQQYDYPDSDETRAVQGKRACRLPVGGEELSQAESNRAIELCKSLGGKNTISRMSNVYLL